MDKVWKTKAVVVFHMIANLTRQGDKLINMLLNVGSVVREGKSINLDMFIRNVKSKYGLIGMKLYISQFIKGTGLPRLYYEFGNVKK